MDVGLYKLSADQTNVDAANELIVFNSTVRACTGVTLSSTFTFAAGTYLTFGNYDFTRTSGGSSSAWVAMLQDPTGTPEIYGFSLPYLAINRDSSGSYAGTLGPSTAIIQTAQNLVLQPASLQAGGGSVHTLNSAYTWLAMINLTGPLVSAGLYSLSANQTNVDTVGEQIVLNSTVRACSGVSLASGELTFTSDGLYLVMGGPAFTRTSGTGTSISYRWTTDSTGAGTTAYANGLAHFCPTEDHTTATGSGAGAVALVERSGSNVVIGLNVATVAASTVFSALGNPGSGGGVTVLRIT